MYNVSCNLKEAYETESKAITKAFQKSIVLHTIDEAWKEHLREMDELRHSVQNASYENKDQSGMYHSLHTMFVNACKTKCDRVIEKLDYCARENRKLIP